MDIEVLEERLSPFVERMALEELPELASRQQPHEVEVAEDVPNVREHLDVEEHITVGNVRVKPLQRKSGLFIKRAKYEQPSPEFGDIFLHGSYVMYKQIETRQYGLELFQAETPERLNASLTSASAPVMHVNTLKGIVKTTTDAWTPEMILCLNRIVNAHTQLLVQSFAACVGMQHLRDAAEEMHALLHSMYQMFHAQSNFDFGFVTMLKSEVPYRLPSAKKSKERSRGKGKNKRKSEKAPKKKRRKNKDVVEVIDLTEEASEDSAPTDNLLSSSLDVPLLHVLPHLWQALMVITTTKQGIFFGRDEIPSDGIAQKHGYLPFLAYPRDVQRVMQFVESMMTFGVRGITTMTEIKHGARWSITERSLLRYSLQLHNDNYHFIKTKYLPLKDVRTLEKHARNKTPDVDKQWKPIEEMLLGTDAVSVTSPEVPANILRAQRQLCLFCNYFRDSHRQVSTTRVNVNPLQRQNASVLKLLQGVVQKSTSRLVEQVFGSRDLSGADSSSTEAVMQNLMCLLLGQIGGQLAGSFDTLFTMMSLIAGMQLLNGAESGSNAQQSQIIEVLQQSRTLETRTEDQRTTTVIPRSSV